MTIQKFITKIEIKGSRENLVKLFPTEESSTEWAIFRNEEKVWKCENPLSETIELVNLIMDLGIPEIQHTQTKIAIKINRSILINYCVYYVSEEMDNKTCSFTVETYTDDEDLHWDKVNVVLEELQTKHVNVIQGLCEVVTRVKC